MAHTYWTRDRIIGEFKANWLHKYRLVSISGEGATAILTIRCPTHGNSQAKAGKFFRSKGCVQCQGNYTWSKERREQASKIQKGILKPRGKDNKQTLTLEEVKARIKSFHGDTYDLRYITDPKPLDGKFTLVCKIHGKFVKTRNDILHTARTGCPKCKGGIRYTTKEFLAIVKPKQPKWFSYGKTLYTRYTDLVTVTCKYHGDFRCRAGKLLHAVSAIGCPSCNEKRIFDKRIASGQYLDPALLPAFRVYRTLVRRLSGQAVRKYAPDRVRDMEVHLDHVFSIREGFKQGVPAHIIGHAVNLRFLPSRENKSKNTRCDFTLNQLYKRYNQFTRRESKWKRKT